MVCVYSNILCLPMVLHVVDIAVYAITRISKSIYLSVTSRAVVYTVSSMGWVIYGSTVRITPKELCSGNCTFEGSSNGSFGKNELLKETV